MTKDELKLSKIGDLVFKEAVKKIKNELKKYNRIRTRFLFPTEDINKVGNIELREFINTILKEYNLDFPFDNRKSDYSFFIQIKSFDILSFQLHRLYPAHYLIVTQKDDGKIIFIIRDREAFPDNNIKITWNNTNLKNGIIEKVPFYLSKANLE